METEGKPAGKKNFLWQRLGRCYPLQLELVPLLLLGLTIYLVLSNYSTLPDTIPSHFNARGVADDWGSKKAIFFFPAFVVPLYVFLSLFNAWISLVKDPKSLINLPDRTKAAMSEARAEELRVLIGRCLFLIRTLTVGLMTYCVYASIEVARGEARGLGIAFYLILGGHTGQHRIHGLEESQSYSIRIKMASAARNRAFPFLGSCRTPHPSPSDFH